MGSQTVSYQCNGSSDVPANLSESFTSDVKRSIKGTEVVSKVSRQDLACLIEQAGGDHLLKDRSDLKRSG